MPADHEIEHLVVELDYDGFSFDKKRFKAKMLEVIERYFNRHDPSQEVFQIDAIHLDLGTIEAKNFEEEFLLRLSYLLNTELAKLFANKELMDELRKSASLEHERLLSFYLKFGFNATNNKSLDDLIRESFSSGVDEFTKVLSSSEAWHTILSRLFAQSDFLFLEHYWSTVEPVLYNTIRKANERIMLYFVQITSPSKIAQIRKFLNEMTFQFMMRNSSKSKQSLLGTSAIHSYVELLLNDANKLADIAGLDDENARQNADLASIAKGAETTSRFEMPMHLAASKMAAYFLLFINNAPGYSLVHEDQLQTWLNQQSPNQLRQFIFSAVLKEEHLELEKALDRLSELLKPPLSQALAKEIEKAETQRFQSLLGYNRVIAQTFRSTFFMNVDGLVNHLFNIQFLTSLYRKNSVSSSSKQSSVSAQFAKGAKRALLQSDERIFLQQLIELLALEISRIKKMPVSLVLSELLKNFDENSSAKKANIKAALDGLLKGQPVESAQIASKVIQWSDMRFLLHYLETGVFLHKSDSPSDVLQRLLLKEREAFKLELLKRIEHPFAWFRFIHQFPIHEVKTFILELFQDDQSAIILASVLKWAEDIGTAVLQQRILWTFILYQKHFDDEKHTFQPEELRNLLENSTASLVKTDLSTEESIESVAEHLLEKWKKSGFVAYDGFDRQLIAEGMLKDVHVVFKYFFEVEEVNIEWRDFLSSLSEEMLLSLLDRVVHTHAIPGLLLATQLFKSSAFQSGADKSLLVSVLLEASKRKTTMIYKHLTSLVPSLSESERENPLYIEWTAIYLQEESHLDMVEELDWLIRLIDDMHDMIASKSLPKKERYSSQSEFEMAFRKAITLHSITLLKELEDTDEDELYSFLKRLSKQTLNLLKGAIEKKFKSKELIDQIHLLKLANFNEHALVDLWIMTFALTQRMVSTHAILHFINKRLPQLRLPPTVSSAVDSFVDAEEVDRLWRQLKTETLEFNKTTELEQFVLKIMQHQSNRLIYNIRIDPSGDDVLVKLLSLLGERYKLHFISLLTGHSANRIHEWLEHPSVSSFADDPSRLGRLLKELLMRKSSDLPQLKRSPLQFYAALMKEKAAAIKAEDMRSKDEFTDRIRELDSEVLIWAIAPNYYNKKNVFQLIEALVRTGMVPRWSLIRNADELNQLLRGLIEVLPVTGRGFIVQRLSYKGAKINLLNLLTPALFFDFLSIIEPNQNKQIETWSSALHRLFKKLGLRVLGQLYFKIELLKLIDVEELLTVRDAALLLVATAPADLALDPEVFHKKLNDHSLESTDQQEEFLVTKYRLINSYVHNQSIPDSEQSLVGQVQPSASQEKYTFDLLIALMLGKRTPWWAQNKQNVAAKDYDNQAVLMERVLERPPKEWLLDLKLTGHFNRILPAFIKAMNLRQFDRLLLEISPEQGGFVVSLNNLLLRTNLEFKDDEWRVFAAKYFLEYQFIEVQKFLKSALSFLVKVSPLSYTQLVSMMLSAAQDAVKKHEFKFQVFVDLLETLAKPNKLVDQTNAGKQDQEKVTEQFELTVDESPYINLEGTIEHYLVTGSIPISMSALFSEYEDFNVFVGRYAIEQPQRTKDVLRNALRSAATRKRILKQESPHFIDLMFRVLFSKAHRHLTVQKHDVFVALEIFWTKANVRVLEDFFHAYLLEQAIGDKSSDLKAETIFVSFAKNIEAIIGMPDAELTELVVFDTPYSELNVLLNQLQDAMIERENGLESADLKDTDSSTPDSETDTSNAEAVKNGQLQNAGDDQAQKYQTHMMKDDTNPRSESNDSIHNPKPEEEKMNKEGLEKGKIPKEATSDDSQLKKPYSPESNIPTKKEDVDQDFDSVPDIMVDFNVNIKNAGLVIASPYFTRYFEILEMTENGAFKTPMLARRAVLLLQFVATGLDSAEEHELLLNKVLCGLKIATPVASEIELTDREREVSEQMLKGLLANWKRLEKTSIDALREGFIIRDGALIESEKTWSLTVEKKTLDILMDSIPWSYSMVRLPWMEKRLIVEWGE